MWGIILKDIEQHAKAISIFLLTALILPSAFSIIMSQKADGSGYLGVVFGYVVVSAPALFVFGLIGQEKLKGTFKLLSILPISGRRVIWAKSLAAAILCIAVVNLVAVVTPMIIYAVIGYKWFSSSQLILWINLLTLFFVSVDVTIFTLLENKIASQAIYLTYFFVVFATLIAKKYLPILADPQLLIQRLSAIGFQYWGWMLVILLSYALVDISGRIFEMREWAELEEE
ncbi:MAG: hypothetical protein L0226_01480 [Acidobacteria bacterium]|nr:hypothetical protein [Acidobacteriota bacterium]